MNSNTFNSNKHNKLCICHQVQEKKSSLYVESEHRLADDEIATPPPSRPHSAGRTRTSVSTENTTASKQIYVNCMCVAFLTVLGEGGTGPSRNIAKGVSVEIHVGGWA